MHKITIVSLCDTIDTLITCFILRTLVTKHIKMPKSTVHFPVLNNMNTFFYRTFILCSKRSAILPFYDNKICRTEEM